MPVKISFGRRLLDFFFPRECAICGRRLSASANSICMSCNLHLPRTHYQMNPKDNEMARMFWALMPIENAAALFFYQSHSRTSNIILQLKYNGKRNIGIDMGKIMAYDFNDYNYFDGVDIIVPVPITFKRKLERGYNQSHEIAVGVKAITGIPIAEDAVIRKIFTSSQTQKHSFERKQNVENVFEMKNNKQIIGKHVLLIDDVVTTGSTIQACAKELLKGGARTFSVLSIGYTKG